MQPVAVHFSPHPDDELLGAPAALFMLRDAGWRIVNVACSLGRPAQHARRRGELEEACRRAAFELRVDDTEPSAVLAELHPTLVLAPSPHDRHPFHEEVGRAALAAVAAADDPRTVWLWGLWGELPLPSLVVEVTDERLDEIEHALSAHAGELERNDAGRLLRARSAANAVVGAERVFGFGSRALPFRRAELLTELRLGDGRWRLCEPRILDRAEAAGDGVAGETDVTTWLAEPSLTSRYGSRHASPSP
ncbi:MAG TPA: PIG-L family deacetylase [Gaiellaceae bacterium]|nr:PIG-L family deacetylase [Gaiellaceae bacterium]